jgi:hypothetical protein
MQVAARRGIISRSASCPRKPRSPAIIVADLTDFGNAVWLVHLLAGCGAAEEQERWAVVANPGFPLDAFIQNLIEMDRAERAAAGRGAEARPGAGAAAAPGGIGRGRGGTFADVGKAADIPR